MKPPPLLSAYLGRHFISGFCLMMGIFAVLAFVIDLAELFRRIWGREGVSVWIILQLAILKIPYMAQKVLPFAALFGGMLAFLRLTRTNQLVVARAAGLSVWQFLFPTLAIALVSGLFVVTLFNPLVSATTSAYEALESKHLRGRSSLLSVSKSGLWLRQSNQSGQSVIHALGISQKGTELTDVIVFLYEGTDKFTGRIDAQGAVLQTGSWLLSKALISGPDRMVERHDKYSLPTTLTLEQIQDSFASPETMSFWALPAFIETLEKTGFSALRHRLHWHSIMAGPLLLCAMVLIAATFSIRLTRRGGTGLLIAGGILTGFVLYFLSDVLYAMGLSGALPAPLAAWAPAGICTLLGLTMMFYLEDG